VYRAAYRLDQDWIVGGGRLASLLLLVDRRPALAKGGGRSQGGGSDLPRACFPTR